ncbi:hypothetical protein [Planctobacterium marinum]|uniref:hypothetical protein n=1 Tax=Planctobacterium marinum TaxID=1631968 RepID=UPI001E2AF90D|nr:hypothetical protein [Planctobacterium marinum]MCC2605262.1 hypothetical protein [Planctobacterium marinum]
MANFKQHGSFEAHLVGRIIVFKGTGPWNLESMNAAADEFTALTRPLYGSPWGMVGDFYGQAIHVPEAADKLVEIVLREKQVGRTATGLVITHSDAPLMSQKHLSEIYGKAAEPHDFFASVDDAIAWVNEKISAAE